MTGADEFFCKKCRRIKSRCVCSVKNTVERNLELYERCCRDESLKTLFQGNYEVVDYREMGRSQSATVSVDSLKISSHMKKALKTRGIHHVYRFQKEAIDSILLGKDTIISAPTGMGKTEAFLIPVLEKVSPDRKAAVVYPTKALAKDQLEKIEYYASFRNTRVVKFDGDSDSVDRMLVLRGKADIILTNPDMMDYHLRNSPEFRKFMSRVGMMVFDELHSYTGFFGSNIYWLVRRIERFTTPQIIACSATIGNPEEFGKQLFDRDFAVISADERKTHMGLMIVYGDPYRAILDIVTRLRNRKILIFGNSYRFVETVAWMLESKGIKCPVHKAGFPRDIRERVERMFRDGDVNVLASTSTLELGIDIGDVDCVLSELVPHPVFIQRSGRAGRNLAKGLGILVLRDDSAIGEYYRKNPEQYYRERMLCYAERDNEIVLAHHLHSMALEKPLMKNEVEKEHAEKMLRNGILIDAGDIYIAGSANSGFSMRGAGRRVKIVSVGKVIGERVMPVAIRELHPGAVFLHNRKRWVVKKLDLEKMTAFVEPFDKNWVSVPLYTTLPKITRISNSRSSPLNSHYCEMVMTCIVNGYILRNVRDREIIKTEYLRKPVSYSFKTRGFVFSAPYPERRNHDDFYAGSFHALEHALIETSDAITGGGSNVIGGISTPDGYIFIYDGMEGGNGMSKLLYDRISRALQISLSVLENCDCKRIDGCPRCTYSYQCGNNNQPLNRNGAIDVLKKIMNGVKREADVSIFRDVRDFTYYP